MAAGLVLDDVQHWPVFIEVPELFILVPALLGLKVSKDQFDILGEIMLLYSLYSLACLVDVNISGAIGR